MPEELRDKVSRNFGFAMTYDGYLAIAMPGTIAFMDRNFENFQFIYLQCEGEGGDNGISQENKGGIYCVTLKYMRKVVWDGKTLSDDEADGAWKSEYDCVPNPRALSRGSGNTPALMGFVPDSDKLVVLEDAGEDISVIGSWRDEIPEGFAQKPGTKSRSSGLTIGLRAGIGQKTRESRAESKESAAEWAGFRGEGRQRRRCI